jgi:predicted transcriptional regulator
MNERRHPTVFPGFAEIQARRQQLAAALSARRADLGLSQTEVAARMGTSQSAVARLEAGSLDTRLSTLERYVAAVGARLVWQLEVDQAQAGESRLPGGRQGLDTP